MVKIKIDPAGRDFFIKKITSISTRRVLIILYLELLLALIPVLLSIPEGNFRNNSLKIDALRDIGYYDQFLLLLPFFIIFIPHYLKGFSLSLNSLIETGVVTIDAEETNKVELYANNLFKNRFVTAIPYVVASLFVILDVSTFIFAGKNTWNSAKGLIDISLIEIINIILVFFLFHLVAALLVRIVLTYFVIKKFLNNRVDIQPWHPDNSGGLSPLGDFSLKLTTAGIAIGIPVLLGIMSNYYQHDEPIISLVNILLIVGYISCLSVVFFLPLLGARRCMLDAKKKELKKISDCFQSERKNILSNYMNVDSGKRLEISNLEGLMKLYDIAKGMPVFPFNSQNIIRFLSSILWPVVLILIQYILQKI
jgi:hypothetical protein